MIYVWATQQDSLSKRLIPSGATSVDGVKTGQDVFVPWVLSAPSRKQCGPVDEGQQSNVDEVTVPPVYNRYYHMFEAGELKALVCSAAQELGILERLRPKDYTMSTSAASRECQKYVEVVQDGWERSNFFVELYLWEMRS